MLDEPHLNRGVRDAIGDDVGRTGNDEFARVGDLAGAADEGVGIKEPTGLGMELESMKNPAKH